MKNAQLEYIIVSILMGLSAVAACVSAAPAGIAQPNIGQIRKVVGTRTAAIDIAHAQCLLHAR